MLYSVYGLEPTSSETLVDGMAISGGGAMAAICVFVGSSPVMQFYSVMCRDKSRVSMRRGFFVEWFSVKTAKNVDGLCSFPLGLSCVTL